jgi:hypothetical protein
VPDSPGFDDGTLSLYHTRTKLSPTTNSMEKRCASSLHWCLATELILNFQHTDANTRLAPGDMISVDPAAIRFLQEPKSSKTESSDTDSKPESSDPSQSSPSTKTAFQGLPNTIQPPPIHLQEAYQYAMHSKSAGKLRTTSSATSAPDDDDDNFADLFAYRFAEQQSSTVPFDYSIITLLFHQL